MALRPYSLLKQFVAIWILVALVPSPLLLLPKAKPAMVLGAQGAVPGNPTPEQIAKLKANYKEFQKKTRLEGQKRLLKILENREANWRDVELTAPLWREENGFSSALVINNTFSRAVDVTPVARTAKGEELKGKRLRLRANESVDMRLSELFGDIRGHGQIALQYHGETQEINALVVIMDPERSLVTDHPFERKDEFTGSKFEGVFYVPGSSANADLALSNSSDAAISVSVSVRVEDDTEVRAIKVGPRQTESVNMRPLLKGSNGSAPTAARVVVEHTGRPGDLRLHGMVMDNKGYSANMRFMEPAAMASGKLFSPVLPLAEATNPVVLLANGNTKSSTIHVEAYYSVGDTLGEQTLRTVSVPAQGAIHVDLRRDMKGLPAGAMNIGLVFHYYANGGILADVLLIDESGSGVYQVSPKGYASHGHTSHSFPVRLAGDANTIITLANPSETEEVTYTLNFFYGKKTYVYKGTRLRPGEILNVDMKALRDQKVLGGGKESIPEDVVSGQAVLHFRPRENTGNAEAHAGHHTSEAIGIASATTYDSKRKMSFVDCAPQCPPEFYTGEVTGNAYWEGILDQASYEIELTTYDAGGSQVNPSGLDVTWNYNGYSVTETYQSSVTLLSAGTAQPYGSVNAWGVYCFVSSCSCGDWIPFFEIGLFAAIYQNYSVTLSTQETQESGKSTHYIALKGQGNVTISASIVPDNPNISWQGGSAGGNNYVRVVDKGTAGDTTVTATVSGVSGSVVIHIVDASAPPQNSAAPKTWAKHATDAVPVGNGIKGVTIVTIGTGLVKRPEFDIDAYLDGNKWMFRLVSVHHVYQQGIKNTNAATMYDLGGTGNPDPFPGPGNLTLAQRHNQARDDFDITGLVPNQGGAVAAPPMTVYWSSAAIWVHEFAHSHRFYELNGAFWLDRMGLFEDTDVEAAAAGVNFDCNNADTMTTAAVKALKMGSDSEANPTGLYQRVQSRHNSADGAECANQCQDSEAYAFGVGNAYFQALRNQIPNP